MTYSMKINSDAKDVDQKSCKCSYCNNTAYITTSHITPIDQTANNNDKNAKGDIYGDNPYAVAIYFCKSCMKNTFMYFYKDYTKTASNELKIVFIDDDPMMCQVMKTFLKDYNITVFNDAVKGVIYIGQELPDLVILDIHMPQITGMEVLKIIKSDAKTSHIPVIILTGDDSYIMKEKAKAEQVASYMNKPFTRTMMTELVGTVIKKR